LTFSRYHGTVPRSHTSRLNKKLEECGPILNTVSSNDTFSLCLADDNVADVINDLV